MPKVTPDAWPLQVAEPDRITLAPVAGGMASDRPPVRIFLGTEPAQWRAERVFVWSVLAVRDPARAYEIFRMGDLAGFDRRRWRTGFTNYRYAIPDLAGGAGRAIYNDVDQIYLTDPAALFDLDLGQHGYRSIAASDTSVMLMDCARMRPFWNRAAASMGNKYALLNRPRSTPGLWGELDPHWNARDQEYIQGRTHCLHYTALHQQPWQPFPDEFSYHPNPLAWVWHRLERDADAVGFEVFSRELPSPQWAARLGGPGPLAPTRAMGSLDLPEPRPAGPALLVTAAGSATATGLDGGTLQGLQVLTLRGQDDRWPEGPTPTVVVRDLLEHVPPADLGWLLAELFKLASVELDIAVDGRGWDGLGNAAWWQRRVAQAATHHQAIRWRLRTTDPQATPLLTSGGGAVPPQSARTLALTAGSDRDADTLALAAHLDPDFLQAAAVAPGGAAEASPAYAAPLPADLAVVIAADPAAVAVGRSLRRARGEAAPLLVQLGAPRGAPADLDLVVATADAGLPIRPWIAQTVAPLTPPAPDAATLAAWEERLAGFAHPILAVLVPPSGEAAAALAPALRALVAEPGGGVLLLTGEVAAAEPADALATLLGGATRRGEANGPDDWTALAHLASGLVVPEGAMDAILAGVLAGHPVHVIPAVVQPKPAWRRRVDGLFGYVTGQGTTYRGTPHQQHAMGRWLDALVVRGLVRRRPDPALQRQALAARGLIQTLGQPPRVAPPQPLDDLAQTADRLRAMAAVRTAASTGR